MPYNFTDDVRRALQTAREEAYRLHHDTVQPIHILLGVLRHPGRKCADALKKLGVDANTLSEAVRPAAPRPLARPPNGLDLPYAARAKRVLESSMAQARDLHHGYVGPEHFFLAVLEQEDEIATLVNGAGVTADGFRSALRELGPSEPHSTMDLGSAHFSLQAPPSSIKWIALVFASSRLVGWIALVIAVVALILAIRAQP